MLTDSIVSLSVTRKLSSMLRERPEFLPGDAHQGRLEPHRVGVCRVLDQTEQSGERGDESPPHLLLRQAFQCAEQGRPGLVQRRLKLGMLGTHRVMVDRDRWSGHGVRLGPINSLALPGAFAIVSKDSSPAARAAQHRRNDLT